MNVSHSNRHTKRVFAVNLQKTTINTDVGPRQIRVCTRCLRTMSKVNA
jgi:large subunit ribosomal protein L28